MDNTIEVVNQFAELESELGAILEQLLEANETISLRAITARHKTIRHASTISRSKRRMAIVSHYQDLQRQRRKWINSASKQSPEKLSAALAERDAKIKRLEKEVQTLRVSHVAMMRAVGEMGGISKWLRFFQDFSDIKQTLTELDVYPPTQVLHMKTPTN
jgi:sugar-specific transcriptional regulator TrmB